VIAQLQYRAAPTRELYRAVNDATMVVVQFESAEAIERAEEIFAVEGVDMALFGTNDLTADMGIPGDYENPRVREAYARAIAAAKKHGKHVGVGGLGSRPKLTAEFVKMGARYVSTGTDLGFLLSAATEQAKQVRALEV
jgi:2-keto-3-deoxy-L-rhamnonate aldolase RhmA